MFFVKNACLQVYDAVWANWYLVNVLRDSLSSSAVFIFGFVYSEYELSNILRNVNKLGLRRPEEKGTRFFETYVTINQYTRRHIAEVLSPSL
jgi:phage-related holin